MSCLCRLRAACTPSTSHSTASLYQVGGLSLSTLAHRILSTHSLVQSSACPRRHIRPHKRAPLLSVCRQTDRQRHACYHLLHISSSSLFPPVSFPRLLPSPVQLRAVLGMQCTGNSQYRCPSHLHLCLLIFWVISTTATLFGRTPASFRSPLAA